MSVVHANGVDALAIAGVSKSYGKTKALDKVDLVVRPGEFVALLGPNGAGKSTLFQVLTGLFVPDAGSVSVAGHDMRRQPVPALAKIGIVFQQPTIDLELTVESNLRFHCQLHGLSRGEAQSRIKTELERVGMTDRATEQTRALSGGSRRRIELARALLHRPTVLLMDEPTVGLDPASRRDLLDHVLRLRAAGDLAILWATHLVDEARRADRVIVLHRGKVLRDSTPDGLISEAKVATLDEAFLALTGGARPAAADAARASA
jgi:ABC-2 type transport system ATP-binding protein